MIFRTTRHADAVLAFVEYLMPEDLRLILEPYQNGREHGWALCHYPRQVSFSEYRNSDDIVVYPGLSHQFDMGGNVPEDEPWEARRFFHWDQPAAAAQFILDYLREEE